MISFHSCAITLIEVIPHEKQIELRIRNQLKTNLTKNFWNLTKSIEEMARHPPERKLSSEKN